MTAHFPLLVQFCIPVGWSGSYGGLSNRLLLYWFQVQEPNLFNLKAMLRSITALVILDDHNVRSWVLRVTFSFLGRSVDSGWPGVDLRHCQVVDDWDDTSFLVGVVRSFYGARLVLLGWPKVRAYGVTELGSLQLSPHLNSSSSLSLLRGCYGFPWGASPKFW